MARHRWTPLEEEMLRHHYADSLTVDLARVLGIPIKRVLAKANAMGLHKTVELVAETARERTSRPDHGSHATRFKPGAAPVNKGLKHPPGWSPGRMAEGQFKPGSKPHTWVPVGSLRITEGQLQRKCNDDPGPSSVRWIPVTRLVWEAAHGPIPAGHAVVFRPGRATTVEAEITPDALECLSRAELMQRNTVHRYGPEIAYISLLRGAIRRQINQQTQQTQQTQGGHRE